MPQREGELSDYKKGRRTAWARTILYTVALDVLQDLNGSSWIVDQHVSLNEF